jgi:hypothetical protein
MTRRAIAGAAGFALLLLAACGAGGSAAGSVTTSPTATPAHPHSHSSRPHTPSPAAVESPVPAESNPPGDIPDNTQFVPYRSRSGGFAISVPEGWSRATGRGSVTFTDKLNTIVVTWLSASRAPTISSATSSDVPQLRRSERAFRLKSVQPTRLPAGSGVLIDYQANSAPDRVTGKQYRLDVLRYELFRGGVEVAIDLRSPVGADNVDPWRIVTQSFRWS